MTFEAQTARDRMQLVQSFKKLTTFFAKAENSNNVCSFPTHGIRNRGIARYGHAAFGSSSSEDRGNRGQAAIHTKIKKKFSLITKPEEASLS